MDHSSQALQRGRPVSSIDAAKANDIFEHFISAGTLKTILGSYQNVCDLLHLKPNVFPLFYPKLKANLNSWKAKALWKKFDARASHKCYARGKICPNTRVLIIGAGPCGLRTAIEAQLLGAKVVVIEKRDRMSRNNVLHLWPFVIEDLRALGAKKFFGKFCAGAIDHISIRQLQCILLKVALLLGVEVHTEVSFEKLIEPVSAERIGWRAEFKPITHPVSQYEFDVIIGADGKRNTLQGFKRKEFRGKLAIAITANFINKRTEAEARVEEISGVAFIFNQKFFKELNAETGIDLENIVYYKDDTHYFVMTAKKPSLIDKGVIKQDYSDTARLLAPDNVDRDNLMEYAREAAEFSTNYQMLNLEFAVNHYGQPDVAMFDFTSMYAAENASKVIERHGYKLLMILVGDSLLEPFWPTGSGCARGFLSSLDACWAIKAWGSGQATPLEVLAERESIYRLLAQTTPENLNKDCKAYTVDPSSRYPNLNKALLMPQQVLSLYDTDDPSNIELRSRTPQPVTINESHRKRRRNMHLDPNTLINWIKEQIKEYEDLSVNDITTSFKDGRILCAILHHYRPDLLDYSAIKPEHIIKNNQLAFDLLEKEIGISPVMTGEDIAKVDVPDYLTMFSYLTQIYDTFRGEIPHIKHLKLDLQETKESSRLSKGTNINAYTTNSDTNLTTQFSNRSKRQADVFLNKPTVVPERKNKKRKSVEKYEMSVEERRKRLEEIAANRADQQNKRRQQRKKQTEQFIKSMQMLHMNAKPDASEPFEDYSLFVYRQTAPHFQDRVKNLEKKFTYVPDRENRVPTQSKGNYGDEELAARIKVLEDKWRDPIPTDKRPKDLRRAIGKIETSDWNIKEIEKKIMENKMGKSVNKEKERVPKWNREQFLARQIKLEKHNLKKQNSAEAKFSELDKSLKHLEQRLKEGSVRDLGSKKVATITEKFIPKNNKIEVVPFPKSITKSTVLLPTYSGSEYCHFCQKRVYLMERLSAEGRFFHRGCFKCQYCHAILRLGSYLFDRDGQYGHRFYCSQHYGMLGELKDNQIEPKITKETVKPLENLKIIPLTGVEGVDLLDRVQTPERIEFANLSAGHISSDHDESLSQIDEDEWTDRNFGASTAEICSSNEDEDSSSLSESESNDDDAYEEALDEPPTKEGTLRWIERYKHRYSKKCQGNESDSENYSSSSDHCSYYENSSEDEDDEPATEGEDEIRARELRKQEVRVEPPVVQTDTGSDTEIVSDDSSPESSSKHNSATEISTDSEFAVDEPTPTREIPSIVFNDFHVTKTRSVYGPPKKVQVKSNILQSPINGKIPNQGIQLEFTPLVPSPVLPQSALTSVLDKTKGYALNRTQSTGGIATKVSLELKKKYLLGDNNVPGSIQKSGSVSTLDLKFKSFHTNISDCQKLLKPAAETSPITQSFNKPNECKSPLSPLISQSLSNNLSFKAPDVVSETLSPSKMQIPIIDLTISPKQFDLTTDSKENSLIIEDKKCELESKICPVQDIPLIIPKIDWNQDDKIKDSDISSDSLTTFDSDIDNQNGIKKSPTVKIFENIPRVEVHNDSGEILRNSSENIALDSLSLPAVEYQPIQTSLSSDLPKSIVTEKKSLNQPKILPNLPKKSVCSKVPYEHKYTSGQSTPSEHTTAALTETELSDWANDSTVSDDFEDVEFELNSYFEKMHKSRNPKHANMEEFEEPGHICGKEEKNAQNSLAENLNSILSSIEFMDTGEEVSSDERHLEEAILKNNGYVEFHNEEDIAEDSLNIIVETINPEIKRDLELNNLSSYEKNTGYCIIGNEDSIENFKKKLNTYENEEDSLLIVETGTTTEENTCSDVTVKNLIKENNDTLSNTQLITDNNIFVDQMQVVQQINPSKQENNSDSNKHEEKNTEYEEHCERLQSKIEFGNIRDSIDIRKSKRKDKSDPSVKLEDINSSILEYKDIVIAKTPKDIYTKEEIKKVRDENQKLVQEIVMNTMKAQNRSLERKRRNRNSFSPSLSPNRPFNLNKSAVTNKCSEIAEVDTLISELKTKSIQTPQVSPSNKQHPKHFTKQLSIHSSFQIKPKHGKLKTSLSDASLKQSEALSLPDIQQALKYNNFLTIKSPVTQSNLQKLENKLKAEGKENEDTYIQIKSPAINLEKQNYLRYANDTLKKKHNSFKRSNSGNDAIFMNNTFSSLDLTAKTNTSVATNKQHSYPNRTKSVSELPKQFVEAKFADDFSVAQKLQFCKSNPELLTITSTKKIDKKLKNKDHERRKSISKLISEFFNKKKETSKNSMSKSFLSRISPKSKSKSMINLSGNDADKSPIETIRPNSFSDYQIRQMENISPPPIPPPPKNYTGSSSHYVGDSSDGENDWKHTNRSSCEMLDRSGLQDSRRSSRTTRKIVRQAQIKRHRMAQEIQRKLEETEVKTRELEQRGVEVEKALRGEINNEHNTKDEPELLEEWFNLMRDLIELRRYERELMVKAQEVELEDRHARLQQELRERLDNDEPKTKEDIKTESSIINEMMEVVGKRDSLIALLEQDRLRYSEEDRDFEEQVLAKGLQLTPIQNSNK